MYNIKLTNCKTNREVCTLFTSILLLLTNVTLCLSDTYSVNRWRLFVLCYMYMHTSSGGTRNFLWGGHRGGKMWFWGGKNPKTCRKWLILAIFSSDRGGQVGAEPPTGGRKCPDAATAYVEICRVGYGLTVHFSTRSFLSFYYLHVFLQHKKFKEKIK